MALLIRLALIGVAGTFTTLGFAELSADGETLVIRVGPMAEWLAEWSTEAGIAATALWAAMWARAKKKGGLT